MTMKNFIHKCLSFTTPYLMAFSVLYFLSGAVFGASDESNRNLTPAQCATLMNFESKMEFPEKPVSGNFIAIQEEIYGLETRHVNRLNEQLQQLLQDKATSVYVVTIANPARYICYDYPYIERYAERLLHEWKLNTPDNNAAILFLVSGGDSQIKLAGVLEGKYEDKIKTILSTLVMSNFSDSQELLAVLDGVDGLDAMIRGKSLPGKSIPLDVIINKVLIVLAIIFVIGILIYAIKTWDKNNEFGGSPGIDGSDGGDGGGC